MKAEFVQELNKKKITNTAIFNCCCIALPFLSILLLLFVTPSSSVVEFCKSEEMATLGGLKDSPSSQNSLEIESLARFAVDEHNKKENALVELGKVVKAQEQVVAGTLHHLTLEVIEAGKKKLYEAKIWVKPWLNFKELQEFKHVGDVPSCTQSDLGVKKDPEESDWQSVVVDDPVLQDAAKHAVKTIQQRSNSLLPYELHEIVHAKAAVNDGAVKFDMLLKLNRGDKQEKFKVEVSNHEGSFKLNQMTPDHS